ncbi:TPR-like protein [Metschnikowia bicuspidata var. bicuspidata NRRL YB-4993]|uniref:TPR-like protein n=1 Tax=Metschnikowia bicuspidata var. bicuspidata NRRL YB-4993 TaxID=869754 RepID=A0A1A0H756_9ASCO|nr:TPR-like protein [Metschnikowia bicuspidata var. bicuspidata NRRL YB-4993]OBA19732.1 TPR-like protein [Metschnikowia bicuspidata var. bicuspidata NRRL YB-4993]
MPKRSQPTLPRHAYATKASDTWMALGSCAASMAIHALALKAYEAALSHTPGRLPALLGWSHLLRMNDVACNETVGCQAALLRLTQAADRFPELPKSADFFKELAECYLLVNLNDPALQAIQQAIQLQPHDASLFLLLAQALIRMGLRAQAALLLLHCLKLLPKSLSLFSASDVETARTAHAELAAIAAADGNIEALINELTATLMLPPPLLARVNEHIALWCALATALERANKIPEALDACERAELAVGLLPRILITHAYLLLLDELRPRAERAMALLTRVVKTEPQAAARPKDADPQDPAAAEDSLGDFLPWCLLGKAYTLLDSPRAAYDAYQIALRRADGLPITWLAVGKLYLELKQLPDALAAYSQALRLQLNENSPGTAAAWDGLSCVYERCDDQLGDAADACLRAALCFQAYGDAKSAEFYENRAKNLRLAALGKAPVPDWSEPVGVPNYFLRDLVNLLPTERIAFVKSIHKTDATDGGPPKPQPGSPNTAERKPDPPTPRLAVEPPLPAHPMVRVMPPYPAHYGPPPSTMMSPPLAAQGPVNDARRSPVALPQMPAEGYPVAMPPGYAYGQYMPMHAGMVAQAPPYGPTHWRR